MPPKKRQKANASPPPSSPVPRPSSPPPSTPAMTSRALRMSYRIGRGETGVLTFEPYKSALLPLWRFRTPSIARASSQALWARFEAYGALGDFVGMDMCRKFIQMGMTRAKRYANHAGGRKYDRRGLEAGEKGTRELPRSEGHEGREEKAEASEVFAEVWRRCRGHEGYARLKAEFVKEQKEWDKEKKAEGGGKHGGGAAASKTVQKTCVVALSPGFRVAEARLQHPTATTRAKKLRTTPPAHRTGHDKATLQALAQRTSSGVKATRRKLFGSSPVSVQMQPWNMSPCQIKPDLTPSKEPRDDVWEAHRRLIDRTGMVLDTSSASLGDFLYTSSVS
ncbi:hypothetical protein LTR66_003535 [Elasticomyces elasticus]|nr:hypothetical protein LTR66_003535 [Elasticomyces elasticus]